MNLFETARGTVVAIPLPSGDNPFSVTIDGLSRNGTRQPAFGAGRGFSQFILTETDFDRSIGLQVSHALSPQVYTYAFAERAGSMRLSGILVPTVCGASSSTNSLKELMEYFDSYNAFKREAPLAVAIGSGPKVVVLQALLQEVKVNIARPEQMLGQVAFGFRTIPDRGGS
jgi:hypothetical protein